MIGKIRCDHDPEKTAKAIKWANDRGAHFGGVSDSLKAVYALFLNEEVLTYTQHPGLYRDDYRPDITGLVFSGEAPAKDAEQEAKQDADKPRLTLVPMSIIWDIAKVREFAVTHKYKDPDNWKTVAPERYREAAFRHFLRYLDDPQGVDEESGLPHRWHLETNLAFLAALEGEKND